MRDKDAVYTLVFYEQDVKHLIELKGFFRTTSKVISYHKTQTFQQESPWIEI